LKGGHQVTQEHRDYILMKEIYHCSPKDLEDIPEWELDMHFAFLMAERKHDYIESKRAEQKSKLKNSFRK